MRLTNTLKLTLPPVNSTQNWGAIINNNFIELDRTITKVLSELETTKGLIGIGSPYYKELLDSSGNSYKFLSIGQDGTFTYYTEINSNGGIDDSSITYGTTEKPLNTVPVGTGAYIIDQEVELTQSGDTTKFKRGDLVVAVLQIGSVYDSTYGNIVFKKYPDTGFYIEPTIKTNNNNVVIEYTQKTYPDWVLKAAEPEPDNYAAVPAFHFVTKNITEDTITHTFTDTTSDDDIGVIINFYHKTNEHKIPVTVAYNYTVSKPDNNTIKITISGYPDSIKNNQAIWCDIYAGRSISATVT